MLIDVRRPPLLPYEKGRCSWCGDPIETRLKNDGTPHAVQASFHNDVKRRCGLEYRQCFSASNFFDQVADRDGERCASCGAAPETWWNGGLAVTHRGEAFTVVERRSLLVVDHKIPLWKVVHLPALERRWYFLPGTMQLLCADPCHARKTADEAAERAHFKRLGAVPQPELRGRDGQRLV